MTPGTDGVVNDQTLPPPKVQSIAPPQESVESAVELVTNYHHPDLSQPPSSAALR